MKETAASIVTGATATALIQRLNSMSYSPLSPAWSVRLFARPRCRVADWWGGDYMKENPRQHTGGWGGLPHTTLHAFNLCPPPTQPPLGVLISFGLIFMQAGTSPPPILFFSVLNFILSIYLNLLSEVTYHVKIKESSP